MWTRTPHHLERARAAWGVIPVEVPIVRHMSACQLRSRGEPSLGPVAELEEGRVRRRGERLAEVESTERVARAKLGVKGEFALALLPTLTVLAMLGLVELLNHHRLLFTSLASSAFLIYLDPRHEMNAARTLVIAHLGAASIGLLADVTFGSGYLAAGSAMVLTILLMILFDVMHPPAVATSLTFTFQPDVELIVFPFVFALGVIVVLVVLKHLMLWLLVYLGRS
jgi:CBS-domain-containing membrane protein